MLGYTPPFIKCITWFSGPSTLWGHFTSGCRKKRKKIGLALGDYDIPVDYSSLILMQLSESKLVKYYVRY